MTARVPFPGSRSPAAGFDQPFEMLSACHDRVRRSLSLLQKLVAHVGSKGVDAAASDAARDVLRYFDVAAPQHHRDEELHVVPVLIGSGDERLVEVARRMLVDHEVIAQRWATLRPLLQALVDEGIAAATLGEAAQAFVDVHRDHLAIEDAQAFPHAKARAEPDALAEVGREMAQRRGARPG